MNIPALDIFVYIQNQYPTLTSAQKRIADYLFKNYNFAVNHTALEVAQDAGVSEASVIRFCQAIGFKGFKELKLRIARDMGHSSGTPVPRGIEKTDKPWDVMEKLIQMEYEDISFCLEMLDPDSMLQVLELISAADQVAFFGVGSSSLVTETAKEHFLYYGKKAISETESYSQIGLANTLTSSDLAVAVSISGESLIPIQAIQVARKNHVPTVCITQNPNSNLARLCDHSIVCFRKNSELDDLGTSSRIVLISIIDALAVAYAAQNWDQSAAIVRENREIFKSQNINIRKYLQESR